MSSILASPELASAKQQFIAQMLARNILLEDELLDVLQRITSPADLTLLTNFLCTAGSDAATLSVPDIRMLLAQSAAMSPWPEIDRLQQLFAQPVLEAPPTASDPISSNTITPSIRIISSYKDRPKKRELIDFVSYFTARYHKLRAILQQRPELSQLSSIGRLQQRRDRSQVSLIGMVIDKQTTKNGNTMLTLEDPTGTTKVLINQNRPDLSAIAADIVFDEVLGIHGTSGDGIIFANGIIFPDVPVTKELKRAPDEVYAIFLSDIHVGSRKFLSAEFAKLLAWLSGTTGSDAQRAIAGKVRYLFIMGDVVDGVGIYPNQERELVITDVQQQYECVAELLRKIPTNIQIIMCPGNHDAMRISEPQPIFYKDFSAALHTIPNLTLVTNPGMVTIHASPTFPGFDVLMYHGYSFDHYIANVDSIRRSGGYDRADLIMKFLLQKRHLAPTHSSTLYIPDPNDDPLVIDRVPDFFATGHLHKTAVSSYRNVTLISGSCWQARTPFQEKMGHHPEPARVPMVNLRTREIKILRFDTPETPPERTEVTHG